MTNSNQEKYSRLKILPKIGSKGQEAIFNAKVGIFGLGGLGSWSSLLLAQMGVGFLRLIDRDVVEVSNLSRTPIYTFDSVDLPKAEEATKFLQRINPEMKIEQKVVNIDKQSIDELVKDLDVVIDGLDNISTRLIINETCKKLNKPYIFSGAIAMSGNISTFLYNDSDPCLHCIFGLISDDELEKCDILGVHTALLSIIASLQVTEAIKIITNDKPVFRGKLGYMHLDNLELDHIPFKQNKSCPVCFPTAQKPSKAKRKILELCGDKTFLITKNNIEKTDFNLIINNIEKTGSIIIKKGSLGLTFKLNNNEKDVFVSIFANGNILIRGESEPTKVQNIFDYVEKNIFI